jgi:phosphoribosylformylglycinamidine (FGAM) synthase-like amidotransferase family enzyme
VLVLMNKRIIGICNSYVIVLVFLLLSNLSDNPNDHFIYDTVLFEIGLTCVFYKKMEGISTSEGSHKLKHARKNKSGVR